MSLIAISRIRDEDDIVEAFVRHHAALVDHHILLDNGSTDRTVDILRALKAEGLPITLFAQNAMNFVEESYNTFLFRHAAAMGAEWALCLDVDEFIDARRLATSLRDHLAATPATVVGVELSHYHATGADVAAERIVPRRLRHRDVEGTGILKVFARTRLAAAGALIGPGNHTVSLLGRIVPASRDPHITLAHYPVRSGWQMLAKALVGRLKVLASGEEVVSRQTSVHYTGLLSNLDEHPEWLLYDRGFLEANRPPEHLGKPVVDDPLDYRGGALSHTRPDEPRVHAARSAMAYLEDLARRHGALVDAIPAVTALAARWQGEIERVF